MMPLTCARFLPHCTANAFRKRGKVPALCDAAACTSLMGSMTRLRSGCEVAPAVQNAFPNAYTLAIAGKQPFIMLNTSLLELLSEEELQCVIAHELGHLKCDHGMWLTVGNVLATSTTNFLPVISGAIEEALFRWMRAAELTCDRCIVVHSSVLCRAVLPAVSCA